MAMIAGYVAASSAAAGTIPTSAGGNKPAKGSGGGVTGNGNGGGNDSGSGSGTRAGEGGKAGNGLSPGSPPLGFSPLPPKDVPPSVSVFTALTSP